MSTELTRQNASLRRPMARRNTMAFPRELRDAIPDLHTGRVLELDSVNGIASNDTLFGRRVSLKLVVKETGKLAGQFVVRMDLQVDATRKLAATLSHLADEAERSEPVEISSFIHLSRKRDDE